MKGILTTVLFLAWGATGLAQDPYQSSEDFAKYGMKLREAAILRMEPMTVLPVTPGPSSVPGRYPWKTGIVTTTFWVGQSGKKHEGSKSSCWDVHWQESYGGFDNPSPDARRNFIPAAFLPRQNPFYIALPYNDVARETTKPEAKVVIPWFKVTFVKKGKSVCRDRWIAIRSSGGKICYAQWSDCGPFRFDHWQYVFGNEKPKPNVNQGAGLNISPAVRDFLGLGETDVTDWKFVESRDVPKGPWALYGDNNPFVQQGRAAPDRIAPSEAPSGPTIVPRQATPAD